MTTNDMPIPQPTEPIALHLLNAQEAADYLRISLSTLNRLERRGELKPLRTPGGHRRYTTPMLNALLKPADEPDARS
ncbi:MAG TPA: helix-turn-helix domain-containing protein [Anaerolineaceae bacterium]|nr:helix-turn-helix domain-containing protein [Anaerolineaceae bacterium]